jgi:hypothetical protein
MYQAAAGQPSNRSCRLATASVARVPTTGAF